MNPGEKNPLRLLLTAVQFYTRVPVPRWVGHSEAQLAAATPYFPVVGIGIGLVTGLVFELACLGFGPLIAAVLALACGVLLTGAFHEDGFADVCDGFGGGYTKERVLEIMKDSRVGAFGAIGIGLLLLLQAAALAGTAPQPGVGLMALVSAHAFSRALALLVAAEELVPAALLSLPHAVSVSAAIAVAESATPNGLPMLMSFTCPTFS